MPMPAPPMRAATSTARAGRPMLQRKRRLPPLLVAMLFLAGMVFVAAVPRAALAAELRLVCPSEGVSEPQFAETTTGKKIPITDPQLKAVAAKTCNPLLQGDANSAISIVNSRGSPIFVGFTTINHTPGPITWGAGCTKSGTGAMIAAGATCFAKVSSNGVATRFCASTTQTPADCFNAQANHQTMVETNFEPGSNPGCFGQGNCVWFDISVIPSNCTDALWSQSQCANTGGASYNLPVSLSCNNAAIYTCQGPTSTAYGSANYPGKCGNPYSTCSSTPSCQNAYFYPMFYPPQNKYQPNSVCLGGQAFTVNFLSGS